MIRKSFEKRRRGNILPMTAFSIVALLGLVALAVDIGMIAIARNHCQNAADAAATAGCRSISGDASNNYNFDAVSGATIQAAINNKVLGQNLTGNPDDDWDDPALHPQSHVYNSGQVKVEIGSYAYEYNDANLSEEGFKLQMPRTDTTEPYSAVRATVTYNGSYSFGRVFGMSAFDTGATATAVHRPRDIVIIMDMSGSMRFQSLPARPYYGNRTTSLNPESIFPEFGHYSNISAAALRGTSSYSTGSGEFYDPSNISVGIGGGTQSGPPIAEYWFQNQPGETPGPSNRAFTRAPDSFNKNPGGDNYLKENKNTGSDYAKHVEDITGMDETEISNFQTDGYQEYVAAFKGQTQGPGYWGKTFFVWPPDPRGPAAGMDANNPTHHADNGSKDWRQRFFIKKHYYSTAMGWLDHNNVLWRDDGYLRSPKHPNEKVVTFEKVGSNWAQKTYNYLPNYAAVLKWLNTDPKPFPQRLRAGRIKYYDAIPDHNDVTLNTRWWNTRTRYLTDLNERFWKGYIDFVLGCTGDRSSIHYYSNTRSNTPNNGTRYMRIIGNGGPYDWGTQTVHQRPYTYMEGTIKSGYSYPAGYAANNSIYINYSSLTGVDKHNPQSNENNSSDPNWIEVDGKFYKIAKDRSYGGSEFRIYLTSATKTAFDITKKVRFWSTYPGFVMHMRDNPKRFRHHYWFGAMTMIDYLGNYNDSKFWWPGNVPEAQSWQCKIGIQTAIDDIKNNHPNDFVGMTFFNAPKYSASGSGQHNLARVSLGRNYLQLKDLLWFPPTTVTGGATEITPWDADFTQVPRAIGATSPQMGFMIAYNLFSSSGNLRFYAQPQSKYKGVIGGLGRKGASRIVIFETDGAPNTRSQRSLVVSGSDSYYPIRIKNPDDLADSQNIEWPYGGSYANSEVYDVVKQICAMDTANPPGFSTPRKKAQVFCIAYGTLFDPANSGDSNHKPALDFLQTIQYHGNTASTMNGNDFPQFQKIYGNNTQRIDRIREAIAAILQGGVQVSLIE